MSLVLIYSKLMAMYLAEIKMISVLNDFLRVDPIDALLKVALYSKIMFLEGKILLMLMFLLNQCLDANEINDVKVNEQILRNERLKIHTFTTWR